MPPCTRAVNSGSCLGGRRLDRSRHADRECFILEGYGPIPSIEGWGTLGKESSRKLVWSARPTVGSKSFARLTVYLTRRRKKEMGEINVSIARK